MKTLAIDIGGPVNFEKQVIALSTHVAGWSDFPLAAFLRDETGMPAVADNDGFVGALGESVYGANKGEDPAFVERYVSDLAQGIKILIFLFNPARIAIGGGTICRPRSGLVSPPVRSGRPRRSSCPPNAGRPSCP